MKLGAQIIMGVARGHDFELVGAILGRPTPVDPSRRNARGRATPEVVDAGAFALYRALKCCRRCSTLYQGF